MRILCGILSNPSKIFNLIDFWAIETFHLFIMFPSFIFCNFACPCKVHKKSFQCFQVQIEYFFINNPWNRIISMNCSVQFKKYLLLILISQDILRKNIHWHCYSASGAYLTIFPIIIIIITIAFFIDVWGNLFNQPYLAKFPW